MKQILISILFIWFISNQKENHINTKPKKRCIGFILLEAGKGVDCNGDTISLERKPNQYYWSIKEPLLPRADQ